MTPKLGKLPARPDERDLKISRYIELETVLPTAPLKFGFGRLYGDTGWAMLGNGPDPSVSPDFQGAGDCVFAGAAHEQMIWNKVRNGIDVPFDGRAVLSDYSAVTGYVIGDDSTDQGTYVRDALNYRRQTGIVDSNGARHLIDGYVMIDPKNWDLLVRASYIFGAIGIGFEFPDSAFDQLDAGQPWDVVHGSRVIGGHYVPVVGSVDSPRKATCITWGQRQEFTRAFYEKYNDETWGILTRELIRPDGLGIHNFSWETFQADLDAVAS